MSEALPLRRDRVDRWAEHWADEPGPTDDDLRFLRSTFGTIRRQPARRQQQRAA